MIYELNRLSSASLSGVGSSYGVNTRAYAEMFDYDKHGNISYLGRAGEGGIFLDDLSMDYNGNRLVSVFDGSGSQNQYDVKEYHDKSDLSTEFVYDANGNMITDFDRDIVAIRYNLLNLPDTVQFATGDQIINLYDAGGSKLATRYVTLFTKLAQPLAEGNVMESPAAQGNIIITGADYVGDMEYEAGCYYDDDLEKDVYDYNLVKMHNPDGYLSLVGYPRYYVYRRDHLGNIREVWRPAVSGTPYTAGVVQRTQYYPSGLPWAEGAGASVQPHKHQGKEFIEMHGYDMYDFYARMYDPFTLRTTTMDPLAENYYSISPYAYCGNNPVIFVDPTGTSHFHASTFINPSGTIIDVRNDGDNRIYLVHDPLNWNKSKDNLLVIGYTPEPDTFKDHVGKNIKTPEVVDFYFSELDRLKKNGIAFSWRGLQYLSTLAELKKNQDKYKKTLLELKNITRELLLLNIKLMRSNSQGLALQKKKKAEQLLASKRILLRTGLSVIPNVSIPGDDYVDWLVPYDTSTIDAIFEKELIEIERKYQQTYDNILGL